MADPPRPPLSSLDAAWDDDPTFASDVDGGHTDPDASAAVTVGGVAEPETRAVSGEELDQILDGSRGARTGATQTVQLGGDEIEKLLAKGRAEPPPFASALEVPVARSGGLPDAEEVADAFDRLEGGLGALEDGAEEAPEPELIEPLPDEPSVEAPIVDFFEAPAPPEPPPPAVGGDAGGRFPTNPFAAPIDASPIAQSALLPPPAFDAVAAPPTASPFPPPAPSHPAAPAAWASPVAGAPSPPPSRPVASAGRSILPAGISPRVLAAVVGAAAALAVLTVLVGRAVTGGDEPTVSSADSSPRLGDSVSAPVVAPPTTVERSSGSPEDAAIKALERFREGLVRCVRESIHVLPGTSPAIPASVAQLAGGGYASQPAEWKKPVWGCAHFSLSGPQRFQFQWQQAKVRSDGMAVAWVDSDGDGRADRAFGFKAKLKKRDVVEIGAVEPLDPMPAIASPR